MGPGFESLEVHQTYSSIAQSVERMTVNHDVTGSSPVRGANKKSHGLSVVFLLASWTGVEVKLTSWRFALHDNIFPKGKVAWLALPT